MSGNSSNNKVPLPDEGVLLLHADKVYLRSETSLLVPSSSAPGTCPHFFPASDIVITGLYDSAVPRCVALRCGQGEPCRDCVSNAGQIAASTDEHLGTALCDPSCAFPYQQTPTTLGALRCAVGGCTGAAEARDHKNLLFRHSNVDDPALEGVAPVGFVPGTVQKQSSPSKQKFNPSLIFDIRTHFVVRGDMSPLCHQHNVIAHHLFDSDLATYVRLTQQQATVVGTHHLHREGLLAAFRYTNALQRMLSADPVQRLVSATGQLPPSSRVIPLPRMIMPPSLFFNVSTKEELFESVLTSLQHPLASSVIAARAFYAECRDVTLEKKRQKQLTEFDEGTDNEDDDVDDDDDDRGPEDLLEREPAFYWPNGILAFYAKKTECADKIIEDLHRDPKRRKRLAFTQKESEEGWWMRELSSPTSVHQADVNSNNNRCGHCDARMWKGHVCYESGTNGNGQRFLLCGSCDALMSQMQWRFSYSQQKKPRGSPMRLTLKNNSIRLVLVRGHELLRHQRSGPLTLQAVVACFKQLELYLEWIDSGDLSVTETAIAGSEAEQQHLELMKQQQHPTWVERGRNLQEHLRTFFEAEGIGIGGGLDVGSRHRMQFSPPSYDKGALTSAPHAMPSLAHINAFRGHENECALWESVTPAMMEERFVKMVVALEFFDPNLGRRLEPFEGAVPCAARCEHPNWRGPSGWQYLDITEQQASIINLAFFDTDPGTGFLECDAGKPHVWHHDHVTGIVVARTTVFGNIALRDPAAQSDPDDDNPDDDDEDPFAAAAAAQQTNTDKKQSADERQPSLFLTEPLRMLHYFFDPTNRLTRLVSLPAPSGGTESVAVDVFLLAFAPQISSLRYALTDLHQVLRLLLGDDASDDGEIQAPRHPSFTQQQQLVHQHNFDAYVRATASHTKRVAQDMADRDAGFALLDEQVVDGGARRSIMDVAFEEACKDGGLLQSVKIGTKALFCPATTTVPTRRSVGDAFGHQDAELALRDADRTAFNTAVATRCQLNTQQQRAFAMIDIKIIVQEGQKSASRAIHNSTKTVRYFRAPRGRQLHFSSRFVNAPLPATMAPGEFMQLQEVQQQQSPSRLSSSERPLKQKRAEEQEQEQEYEWEDLEQQQEQQQQQREGEQRDTFLSGIAHVFGAFGGEQYALSRGAVNKD